MKRIFMAIVLVFLMLFLAVPASATWFLACDIPTDNATGSEVRIDGSNPITGLFEISADGQALLLLDLTTYEDGAGHTFEARFTGEGVLPSGWSNPFVPGVLSTPVLRLIQQ